MSLSWQEGNFGAPSADDMMVLFPVAMRVSPVAVMLDGECVNIPIISVEQFFNKKKKASFKARRKDEITYSSTVKATLHIQAYAISANLKSTCQFCFFLLLIKGAVNNAQN